MHDLTLTPGEQLRARREHLKDTRRDDERPKYTRSEIARMAGVSITTMQSIEEGLVGPRTSRAFREVERVLCELERGRELLDEKTEAKA